MNFENIVTILKKIKTKKKHLNIIYPSLMFNCIFQ